jgi:hypothetical protein
MGKRGIGKVRVSNRKKVEAGGSIKTGCTADIRQKEIWSKSLWDGR